MVSISTSNNVTRYEEFAKNCTSQEGKLASQSLLYSITRARQYSDIIHMNLHNAIYLAGIPSRGIYCNVIIIGLTDHG